MIVAEHVSKYYGSFPAVRDLDFQIGHGECVGFLGLNGAGKSTTLRMLAGVLEPTAGNIRIGALDALRDGKSIRAQVGYLPDRPPLYDDMTVEDYLAFAAALRGVASVDVGGRVGDVLQTCALQQVRALPIAALSHGYRQRVGIAQAIVHGPALLVLDEPTQGLDPVQIGEMRALLRRLRGRHTILLSTHILAEIEATCDRILLLHEGRIAAEGNEAELAKRFGAGGRLELEVRGLWATVEAALQSCGVRSAQRLGDVTGAAGREDSVIRVQVEADGDRREEIALALVGAGAGLLGMRRLTSGLEAAFARLQAESDAEARANPSLGA